MGSAVSVPQKSETIAQMEGTWHKLEKEPTGLWRLIGRFFYKIDLFFYSDLSLLFQIRTRTLMFEVLERIIFYKMILM